MNSEAQAFLRFVDFDTPLSLDIFIQKLKKISPNLRYVNNKNIQHIKKSCFFVQAAVLNL